MKEWTGESVVVHYDKFADAWIFIGIHSLRLGPATGGTRMKSYASPQDALRDALKLSESMSYKFALSGLPRGGGKAVIDIPANFDPHQRTDLLHRYGALVKQLNGMFYTGPDVGTSAQDMDIIAETGSPYIFGRTPKAGGAGDSGPITGLGVFAGIQVVCEQIFGDASLKNRRVLVQGAGSLGGTLIGHLQNAGAQVLFSDISEATIRHYRDELGVPFVPSDQVVSTECDIFAPCALGGVLNAESIAKLQCRAVAGGANNQLSESADAERLKARGILYAPDYVINIGGALGITGMETMGWSRAEAEARVIDNVQKTLREVFVISARENITTEAAAHRIAQKRLKG